MEVVKYFLIFSTLDLIAAFNVPLFGRHQINFERIERSDKNYWDWLHNAHNIDINHDWMPVKKQPLPPSTAIHDVPEHQQQLISIDNHIDLPKWNIHMPETIINPEPIVHEPESIQPPKWNLNEHVEQKPIKSYPGDRVHQPLPETQHSVYPEYPQIPTKSESEPSVIQYPQWQYPQVRAPVRPTAHWSDGKKDARCPDNDDRTKPPTFLPGSDKWVFYMCWNGIAYPFQCPENSVFRNEYNMCIDKNWQPFAVPMFYNMIPPTASNH